MLLLAALPGIREIRAALAGGYLWLAFLWLLLDPALGSGNFEAEPFQSAHHLGEEVGPLALGLATTFAAFLIGTLVNEMRGAVGQLYLDARQSANSVTKEERDRIFERLRSESQETRKRLMESWSQFLDGLVPARNDSAEGEQKLTGRIRELPQLVMHFLIAAIVDPIRRWTTAVGDVFMTFVDLYESLTLDIMRRLTARRTEPYKPFLSKQGVKAIERYLATALTPTGAGDRPGVAEVISDFPVIRNRLLRESVDTVSEIDRLRAEAEFRSAVVPPLLAIVGLLAIVVSPWWAVAAPLLLMLLARARAKRREAGDLMADALAQDVVAAPSVESYRGGLIH